MRSPRIVTILVLGLAAACAKPLLGRPARVPSGRTSTTEPAGKVPPVGPPRVQAPLVSSGGWTYVPQPWSGNIYAVAMAPDGRNLWTYGDGTLIIWDLGKGLASRRVTLQPPPPEPSRIILEPQHGRILGLKDRVLWSYGTDGRPQWSLDVGESHSILLDMAPAADGKTVAVYRGAGGLDLWDVSTRRQIATLGTDLGNVERFRFSPDGRLIATVTREGVVSVWDVPARKLRHQVEGPPGIAPAIAFSSDGRRLAVGAASLFGSGEIRLFDTATGQTLRTLPGPRALFISLFFNPQGDTLVSAGTDDVVRLWDPARGEERDGYRAQRRGLHWVAFTPDGELLVSMGVDGVIRLWSPVHRQAVGELGGRAEGNLALAYAPQGNQLAIPDAHVTRLWDSRTGRLLRVLPTPGVVRLRYSPDGSQLAVGDGLGGISLWDPLTGKQLRTLRGHRREITALEFSPDGRLLASVANEDPRPKRNVHYTPPAPPRVIPKAQVWDPHSGALLRGLDLGGGPVLGLAFAPDGQRLLGVGEIGGLRVWDPQGGKLVLQRELPGSAVSFNPRGQEVAVAADTGLLLLHPETFEPRGSWPKYAGRPTYSPDGKILAALGGLSEILLFDREGSGPPGEPRRLRAPEGRLRDLSFSPDGKALAAAAYPGLTRIWALGAEREPVALLSAGEGGLALLHHAYCASGTDPLHALAYVEREGVVPAGQYYWRDHRPDLLMAHLGRATSAEIAVEAARVRRQRETARRSGQVGSAEAPLLQLEPVPLVTDRESLTVSVSAKALRSPLREVRGLVNGRSMSIPMPGATLKQWSGSLTVPLLPGRNLVRVSVLDARGTESPWQVFQVFRASPPARP